ncbi:XRE family transcriptional regulator [Aquamicrobium sp. LC103]|uniref:helix-turn-helix domain-containing protein n=1 Tax=Aquamicrobium sp. LC103 TaxID=1120658 RepID=UPI00063E7967|nr:XRE family transcriptional regulator [Aquamicrobium sp. LC103]TKT74179.1 cupin domain-containing protein [Aquamicrobium sp. LC103]
MTSTKNSVRTEEPKPSPERAADNPVGQMLARLRFENRWTLADVSKRTGVSISALSKIENNQSSPAYSVLVRLAEGLGIDFVDFLGSSSEQFATAARVVTRRNEGRRYATDMGVYEALATDLAAKSLQPMIIEIPYRHQSDRPVRSAHRGEEFVYVIEGDVMFHMEPYSPLTLSQGDSIYFDGSSAHGFSSLSDRPARILSVCLVGRGDVNASAIDKDTPVK